jgi:hypothetical protein
MVQKSSSWEEVRRMFADSSEKNEFEIWIVARELMDSTPVRLRTCCSQTDYKYRCFVGFQEKREGLELAELNIDVGAYLG